MLPKRFFWRLFFSLVASVLLCALLIGGFLYAYLYRSLLSTLQDNLRKETELLGEVILSSSDLVKDPSRITKVVHTDDRITIMLPDGTVLADNWAERLGKEELENHSTRPEFIAAVRNSPIFSQRLSTTVERRMLYYAIPLRSDHRLVYVLRFSFPLTAFEERAAGIRDILLLITFLAVLLSMPFAFILSRIITRPVEELRTGALELASGNLERRVTVEGIQEFQGLAHDFNNMAEQLRERLLNIRQEHRRTEALLSRMVEGVLAIDMQGKAVFANAAFCKMVGLQPEKIHRRSFLEIARNDNLSEFLTELLKGSSSFPESKELKITGPEGEKDYSIQASMIREEQPDQSRILLVFHDITRIRQIEQVRKDFVANVSHELRTPLTALKGSTELLLDGALNDRNQCRKFLEIMDKQLINIQLLVNDMLKLASVEDMRIPLRREATDLRSLVQDIVSILSPIAEKKHQSLEIEIPEEDIILNIDPGQISNALLNLMDNALKYTQDQGSIRLKVKREGDSIVFCVIDNGPGVPREQISRIFERFYRIDKSRSREMGGTGLGLAIARHAVENHGGNISVHSEPGQGTEFTIELPSTALSPAL